MDGVVAVQLGFLKREQVRLLDEHLDAPLEAGQPNLRDQDAIEFLHQERARRALDEASQAFGLDLALAPCTTPLILPMTVFRN